MKPRLAVVTALAAAGGATLLLEQRRRRTYPRTGGSEESGGRWRSVTINRAPEDSSPPGAVPDPLSRWGADLEIRVRRAPGDKGTELSARFRGDSNAGRPKSEREERDRRLRRSLREAKQLIEVGEILRVDPTPHGRRKATPMGALVDFATDRGNEEGLL
jgi:hypothetical protein